MKKKKIIAVMTGLLLVSALLFTACELEVAEAEQRVALTDPYISIQPASYSYIEGETPAALSIEIKDWVEEDGELSYQWYTFTDNNDYVKNGGTPIPGAAGPITGGKVSYTPNFKTQAGDINYFYVVVTNYNSSVNAGSTSGSVQSEVAVISFTKAGDPLPPVISRHPGNARYQAGRSLNSLTVRATARADNGVPRNTVPLSYQWYALPVDTDDSGNVTAIHPAEEIPSANGSTYQPDSSGLKLGKNYFYVEITSTEAAGTKSQNSVPALIQILPGVRATAPVITVQPKDKMYFTDEKVGALKVEGESRDDGTITYKWYKSDRAYVDTNSVTEEIPGATGSEFTPPVATNAAGTFYYYAVVTNTNPRVTGEITATTTSKVAKVSVGAPGEPAFNATVTVGNPMVKENRFQYVRGYGGMDVAWANFPEQEPEDMETMYNPDTGLGYNINRIMISPGKVDPIEGIQDLVSRHRPNYYENVRIVNKYGGYNLASPWSPPKEWKTNNSINGGGDLIETYYKQFAAYLKRFAQNMYDNGAPIYAISISNEPNYTAGYDGCEWKPEQMRKFFEEVGHFTDGVRGWGGGKQRPVVLTVNGESANTPFINVAAMTSPQSRAAIDLLCRHVYGEQTVTLWRYTAAGTQMPSTSNEATFNPPNNSATVNILDRPDGTKYEVWMTEHNINSANATAYPSDSTWPYVWRFMNDVDLVMRINNENAFVWWASKRFYSMIGDGSYNTNNHAVLPRGWGLSHYAKYTIDTHRIGATISGTTAGGTEITNETTSSNVNNRTFSLDNTSARITAYASITSGKDNAPINDTAGLADVEFISLVMWTPTDTNGQSGVDMGTIKIEMPTGFLIGSYTAIRSTSATNVHRAETVTIAADRKSAYVTLPRGQMLSVKFIKE